MATAATASSLEIQNILKTFKASNESDQFIANAIQELDNDNGQFANNIGEVGTWAIQIDEAFDRVTRGFVALNEEFGHDFPELAKYLSEWKGYNQRWISHLALSRDVASEHISVLKRFNTVFIQLVLQIQTDQDREDVITELGQFANEDHDRSAEMSQGFLNLKLDIEDFVTRFDAWIVRTGVELAERAKELQALILELQGEIQELDKKIQEATAALLTSAAGATTMIGVAGLVVAGTTVAILVAQRIIKGKDLSEKQKELAVVNQKQKALAKIKSEFDGLKPDIALICAKLVLFAEIWSSVRSQTLHFRETLKGGLGELSNVRFKLELKLAKDLTLPIIAGLDKYAKALTNKK